LFALPDHVVLILFSGSQPLENESKNRLNYRYSQTTSATGGFLKIDIIRSDIGDMVTISGPDRERHKEIAYPPIGEEELSKLK